MLRTEGISSDFKGCYMLWLTGMLFQDQQNMYIQENVVLGSIILHYMHMRGLHLACWSQSARALMSQRRVVPVLLLKASRWQW